MVLLLMLACVPESSCSEGHSRADDGHCYPQPPPPALEEVLLGFTCEPVEPNGALDLLAGCVNNVCLNQTFSFASSALSPPDLCGPVDAAQLSRCFWEEEGFDVLFEDPDDDGVIDANGRARQIHLSSTASATTSDGIGPGATTTCAVDRFGEPTRVEFRAIDGELQPTRLTYGVLGLQFDDASPRDGRIDDLYLYIP